MAFDYDKEKQVFEEELKAGKYGIERIPNTETDYAEEKENRDLEAYKSYLKSNAFKVLDKEAVR